MSLTSPPPARSEPVSRAGWRTVAILEGMKGLFVLGAGLGLLSLIHRDVQGLADKVVQHFHLNPASRYPHIFLEAATKVTDTGLWLLAMTALLYALARFVEAYGLWYRRRWAQWFAIVTSALYLPIESYELLQGVTAVKALFFLVNAAIILLLSGVLGRAKRDAQEQEA
jgi:uncharacterized membrane protein (DUF2068 family)